jgi:hypothetical protein
MRCDLEAKKSSGRLWRVLNELACGMDAVG